MHRDRAASRQGICGYFTCRLVNIDRNCVMKPTIFCHWRFAIAPQTLILMLTLGIGLISCSRPAAPPQTTLPAEGQDPAIAPIGPATADETAAAVPPAPAPGRTPGSAPETNISQPPQSPKRSAPTPPVPQVESEVERSLQAQNLKVARQSPATTYLNIILESQQAQHLVSGSFKPSLDDLHLDAFADSAEYRVAVVTANAEQAIITATPTQDGFPSYVGAVYAREASLPLAGICRSNLPSQTAPQAPRLLYGQLQCAPGSTPAED